MTRLIIAGLFTVISVIAFSQADSALSNQLSVYAIDKTTNAVRCLEAPKLNGLLDDPCWLAAPPANGFIADRPNPGAVVTYDTDVKVVYDDEALYIGFYNHDTAPDSILNQLTGRDTDGNSDYCGISFSPYHDGLNGWTFAVSPAGEQFDAQESANAGEDVAWNAVWHCVTSIVSDGWIAEFKIPFAALRFSKDVEQVWGINFFREVRRLREHSFWNPVDPTQNGYLTQAGTITGIRDIDPPVRLFFYPFLSAYLDIAGNEDGSYTKTSSYNGGMDVKYGISESFTLDATLIPDFGQTISDALVLNLTPYEVRFDENRQFFTEGTELFSKGGLFYSRRVGYIPWDYQHGIDLKPGEFIERYPSQVQLINATKISGRTKKGTGLGLFNAVSASEHVNVIDEGGQSRSEEYYPLTNYNIMVIDQNLKNNSYVSLINTSVMREGAAYDANVLGTEFSLRNKKNSYAIGGSAAYNRKYNYAAPGEDGYAYDLYASKTSGKLTGSLGHSLSTHTYDPNDLGYLSSNNGIGYWASLNYNIFTPFGKFNRMWSWLYGNYGQLYFPRHFTDYYMEAGVGFTTRKFLSYELYMQSNPVESYDYFEPRIFGRYFLRPSNAMAGAWISTDYRKKLAIDVNVNTAAYSNEDHYMFNYRISPRYRFNDHFNLTYVWSVQNQYNEWGFATFDANEQPVFGNRDVTSFTNVLSFAYAFNPVMTSTCRIRHYWGYSKYEEYYGLSEDGKMIPTDFTGVFEDGSSFVNQSFNSFTIDLVYRWIFSPGSEMTLVWKNAIVNNENQIPDNLVDDIEHVFQLPQSNSFSVKVLYFLDYRTIFGARKPINQG